MFEQKSTETVTLTRSQLQAILELITKIGGLGFSGPQEESKNNMIEDSNSLIINKNMREENLQNNDTMTTTNFYNNREENTMERENWHRYKKWATNDEPVIRLPSSHYTLSPPLTANSSSSGGSQIDLRLLSSLSKNTTDFRRYAHINDSEFDINALQQKRVKALEYRRALAEQREEKLKKIKEEAERVRLEEQLLEKRVYEQQMRMKSEYENEIKLIREKQKLSDSKREAVIAAIENTPVLRKRANLNESTTNLQPSNVVVATILPQSRNKDTFVQTDDSPHPIAESISNSSVASSCNKEVQTDVELLFRWLNDMKYSTKKLNKNDFTHDSKSRTSSSPLNNTQKTYKIKSSKLMGKRGDHSSSASKPIWGMNAQPKYYVKNTDKYPNVRHHEVRKKYSETGCQTLDKKEFKSETSLVTTSISDYRNKNLNDVIDSEKYEPHIRRSTSVATLNSSSEYSAGNSRKIAPNVNFLPQIDLRPHSRRKWYSQQTFNPDLLT